MCSYHTVSPLPDHAVARAPGGLFSVALSFESPRLAVSQHPALRSPDFPRRAEARRDRLSGSSEKLADYTRKEARPRPAFQALGGAGAVGEAEAGSSFISSSQ